MLRSNNLKYQQFYNMYGRQNKIKKNLNNNKLLIDLQP